MLYDFYRISYVKRTQGRTWAPPPGERSEREALRANRSPSLAFKHQTQPNKNLAQTMGK